ncbi:DUF2993 domain-containing protein [Streptomyces syringium]|uniref:LmeA family phospholipid-binding protein n=1 Tax=Streptomyces syringium TaxID=76729 RepID=UPI0036EE2088
MRAIRILLIIAVVLGALFTAADRAAVWFAENEAAEKIRSSQGLSGTPEVSIKGFPFLTQVAGSSLDEVEIKLDGVTANAGDRSIRVTNFKAKLNDVEIDSSFSSAVAQRATGTAHISYEDLTKAAQDPGVSVGHANAGSNKVKVTGKVSVFGQIVERSVVSTVAVVGKDTIRVRADRIPATGFPGAEEMIRAKTDFDRQLSGLPKGVKLEKVVAGADGVDITFSGEKVNLAG